MSSTSRVKPVRAARAACPRRSPLPSAAWRGSSASAGGGLAGQDRHRPRRPLPLRGRHGEGPRGRPPPGRGRDDRPRRRAPLPGDQPREAVGEQPCSSCRRASSTWRGRSRSPPPKARARRGDRQGRASVGRRSQPSSSPGLLDEMHLFLAIDLYDQTPRPTRTSGSRSRRSCWSTWTTSSSAATPRAPSGCSGPRPTAADLCGGYTADRGAVRLAYRDRAGRGREATWSTTQATPPTRRSTAADGRACRTAGNRCTLRAALQQANAMPRWADTINFTQRRFSGQASIRPGTATGCRERGRRSTAARHHGRARADRCGAATAHGDQRPGRTVLRELKLTATSRHRAGVPLGLRVGATTRPRRDRRAQLEDDGVEVPAAAQRPVSTRRRFRAHAPGREAISL